MIPFSFNIKTYVICYILILITCQSYGQQVYVLGKIIDAQTGKPVESATVVNKNSRQITKTGGNGNFLLKAAKGDSIKASSVGFKMAGIVFDGLNKEPVITLRQDAIALREVVVKDKRLEQVKKQIDELLQSPEASTKLKWKDISNLVMMNPSGSTPGSIGISIDGLYQLFSKEGKTRRKLEAMKQEDLKKLLVEYRYNTEYISYITKLKGQELKNFMKYCNLPDNFVLTANDYDLTFEVFRCLEDFKR